MDWDNEIGFWMKPAIYLWIGHSDIYKCQRIYLLPNETEHGDVIFFDDSFTRVCRKDTLDIDPLYILPPPNTTKKDDNNDNMSCSFIFHSFLRAISNFDVFLYIKKHKEMHPTEKYTYKFRKIEKDAETYIPFSPNPFIINSQRSIANQYDIYTPQKIYSFPIEYVDRFVDEGTITYQGIRFYLSSESFLKNMGDASPFHIQSFEMQGMRPNMEDTTLICDMGNDHYMFAVLDGHGDNGQVSRHFSMDIPIKINFLLRKEKGDPSNERYKSIIEEAILLSDKTFYCLNPFIGGTCFSGVLITKDSIFVINIGDSRTVVMHPDKSPLFITKDHKPREEESRILSLLKKNNVDDLEFGKVMMQYIYVANRLPGPSTILENGAVNTTAISVSRALGDNTFKYEYSKSLDTEGFNPIKKADKSWRGKDAYMSPLPDITIFPKEKGMHILIHCDGLNEPYSMKNEENVVNMYKEFLLKNPEENVCRELCRRAFQQGSRDNLSCISVSIL